MNILFLMKNFEMGGIEKVSQVLANYFESQGHTCTFFAFEDAHPLIYEKISPSIKVFTCKDKRISRKNIQALREVLVKSRTDIIINQWGLPFAPTFIAQCARRGLCAKYVSVYHNSPDTNARIQDTLNELKHSTNTIKNGILQIKLWLFSLITRWSMRYVYSQSDAYVLLSPSFIRSFQEFTGIRHAEKVKVITNPLTIPENSCVYEETLKKREIIYVGRMDNGQKRVRRIIDVWELLYRKHPEWKLRFIGDGPERGILECIVRERGMQNVYFEGFCSPIEYYKTASILIQTSEYEGFPLVLAEAMSFGVVPIVYGSYSSVKDIIANKKNGIILSPSQAGFSTQGMADTISRVIDDPALMKEMTLEAVQTSRRYSLRNIYCLWKEIFYENNCQNFER